jgi:hypothetical protein
MRIINYPLSSQAKICFAPHTHGTAIAFPVGYKEPFATLMVAIVFCAFIGTALAIPDNWQGTVLSNNLKVYADPSSTSRTVTILTKGVHVTILVEIEALGIQWCHVQLPGETEPFGVLTLISRLSPCGVVGSRRRLVRELGSARASRPLMRGPSEINYQS